MLDRNELLTQQIGQAGKRKAAKGVKPPLAEGISYNAELQKMVRLIKKDINEQIVPVIRQLEPQYTADGWVDTLTNVVNQVLYRWSSPQFDALAAQLAAKFVRSTSDVTLKRFQASMKSFGLDVYEDSPALQDFVDAAIQDNVQLIKSIPSQYLERVQSIVYSNTRSGLRPGAITKQLQEQHGVTQRRAKFIATDQTTKINGQIAEKRQKAAGFQYFKWQDAEDSRVRHRHDVIAEKVTAYGRGVYKWSNLPLSSEGIPIAPGQDYRCRCVAIPVSNQQVEENKKAGRVNPAVKR